MPLVSQLAFHPMLKIIRHFTSTQALIRTANRVARVYAHSAISHLHACAWTSIFKQLRCKIVQSKHFRLLPGTSLTTLTGPYSIIRYKISINDLTSSASVTSEVFYDIVRAVTARGYLPPGANVCVAAPHPVAYLEIWKGTFQVYIFKSFQILAYFSQ